MNTTPNPRLAITLILAATLFIAATSLLAKAIGTGALGPKLHPMQISMGRFLFAFIGVASIAFLRRPTFVQPNLKRHVMRTLFGWCGVTLMFAAVAFIPLTDATAITFLNPVFAMILAIPLLGERVGALRWLAAAIALTGALILLRPGPGTFQPAALIALAAALAIGFEMIFLKRLAGSEPPFQVLLINNALGLLVACIAAIWVWQPPTDLQWAALAGIGALMAMAQALFVNGMARADASLVVPFTYATLVVATFYDYVFFAVVPDSVSLSGAAVIVSGAALLAWREARIRAL